MVLVLMLVLLLFVLVVVLVVMLPSVVLQMRCLCGSRPADWWPGPLLIFSPSLLLLPSLPPAPTSTSGQTLMPVDTNQQADHIV